jgi:transketolase
MQKQFVESDLRWFPCKNNFHRPLAVQSRNWVVTMRETTATEDLLRRLTLAARRVRMRALQMVHHARIGHPGGDFSAADILVALYLGVLRLRPSDPSWPDRDRFVLSKGHCSAALYATLAEAGFFEEKVLGTFMDPLSILNGHPDRKKVPGVEANTGPLGHGLPLATGMALAARMKKAAWRTFVLTGDGELQEGSNWEAGLCAAQYGLDNLVLIVDRNGIQQGDFVEKIIRMDPMADKWRSFGWQVAEVNGHDFGELLWVLGSSPLLPGKPTCIVANTVKGRGVSFMENNPKWHHHVPTDKELALALAELEGAER